MRTGKAAGSISWNYTDERANEILFAKTPIHELHTRAFFRKDKFTGGLVLNSMADVAASGHTVVGVSGYWYEKQFKELGVKHQLASSPENAWKVLHKGRADLTLQSEIVGKAEIAQYLGAEVVDAYVMSDGIINTAMMFPIFSPTHPQGEMARDIFDNAN